jgi:hypothetical protein
MEFNAAAKELLKFAKHNRNIMIEKSVKKLKLTDPQSDFVYWQSKSPLERLAALEQIRQEYNKWKYADEPGFHRIYKVLKQA